MSLVRVLRSSAATLTRVFSVDETPTDTTAPPTVTVTRLDGTAVVSGTATHTGAPGSGTYTFVLPGGPAAPGSATWQLDLLRVVWAGTLAGAAVTMYDDVEVVGGFYFDLAEGRASDASLADPVKYTTAMLTSRRIQVEQDAEEMMQRAWVPRFARVLLNGNGRQTLACPHVDLRVLRAASVAWVTGSTLAPLTGAALTQIVVDSAGTMSRPAGLPWPQGIGNVLVEYEYGMDVPPESLRQTAMKHLRLVLNANRSGLPDRASSYTTSDGLASTTVRLTQPTMWTTGFPEIDAVYQRWASAPGGFA